MPNVFLSYANPDRQLADDVAVALQALGHQVVYADASISPGEEWRGTLSKALGSADAVLLLITKDSSESRWLMAEAGAAIAYAGERGRPVVIPVVFDGAELPSPLRHIQALFGDRANLSSITPRIGAALEAHIGRQLAADEKRQEARAAIESSAGKYIGESLKQLATRETALRRAAYIWYSIGYFALLGGVGAAVIRAIHFEAASGSWQGLAHFAVLGVAIVAMLVALARYAFSLGKSFMVESLRNSDRRHAISLGEFYIKAFPDRLDWTILKDIFQQWNIDKGSAFLTQDGKDFDPELLAKAVEVARVLVEHEKPGK